MRRLASLLLLFCACATSQPAPSTAASVEKPRKLVIVGINDTHGWLLQQERPRWLERFTDAPVGGVDWFAGYVTAIRAEAAADKGAVVVLDGGDLFQGTLVSNTFKGKSVVEAYNAIGVTAAAVGNHEFDWGVGALRERMAEAKFPILVANVFNKGTRVRPEWARPSVLIDVQGLKIGIIGAATVETPQVTNPVFVEGYEFVEAGPIVAQVADELRAQGATVVLVVAHTGPLDGEGDKASNPGSAEVQRLAASCGSKIDAVVAGHHHTSIGCCPPGQERCRCGTGPLTVAGVPIVQSGAKLVQFSVIELDLDAAGRKIGHRVNRGTQPREGGPQSILHRFRGAPANWRGHPVEPDQRVAEAVKPYDAQVAQLRESRIGSSDVPLSKGGPDPLLSNLAVDALRSGAGGGLPANFAFQNQGGVRVSEIAAGPIKYGQIFDLSPFENTQVVVTLKAHEVRDALEAILKAGKSPLRVSGLRYLIDWGKRDPRRPIANEPPGKLIPLVVDESTGAPLCKTDSCAADQCTATCAAGDYTVAVTDFLANGGDGMAMLKSAPRKVGQILVRDMVIAYVKAHDPLTPSLLGSTAAGAKPRIEQRGGQAAENE